VSLYGSVLRAKTWTMPDPARPGASIGGAAGWLADGTPVWLGGAGGSARVLAAAAPRIAPLFTQITVPDDNACVLVDFFSRYPIREVLGDKGAAAFPEGPLRGDFRVGFVNGNMEALRGATESGLGIGFMPDFLARAAIAAGRLQPLLTDFLDGPGQFHLLWASNRHLSPKVRVFVDFLSERLFSSHCAIEA